MTSNRHFVLSFFGPMLTAGLFCGLIVLAWNFLEKHHIPPLVTMLVGGLVVGMATRWFVRNCVAVTCPFCRGQSYEIPNRANRFMCRVCGKDH
ncbi:hypothetical protein [Prosthecobacter sp.]|uniref:hypothetical protein n=1 Tax=Prosthecobacter sp. TaxID=1965333 RepID=UPI003784004F